LRNHTANNTATSSAPAATSHLSPTRRSFSSALLVGSLTGFIGLTSLAGTAPSALAAEPSALPQAYSAKIVDTASLTSATASATPNTPGTPNTGLVAPVVSMLPVPSTKPDPAAAAQLVPAAKKKKVKKRVAPTTSEAPLTEEALALPANKIKLSKTPDTKAPVAAKETSSNSSLDAAFAALRKCESGGNYKTATGNGYYGAYQFDPRTWRALGYSGLPSDAAPEVQDEAARKLLAKAGWGQWPACSRKLGLR
jgi:hypothetical protein